MARTGRPPKRQPDFDAALPIAEELIRLVEMPITGDYTGVEYAFRLGNVKATAERLADALGIKCARG